MTIVYRSIPYDIDGLMFDAVLVADGQFNRDIPTVLVFHGMEGRSQAQLDYCAEIATLGFQAIAVDIFGAAASAVGMSATRQLMQEFLQDRNALRARLIRAVDAVAGGPDVDRHTLVAAGFCFGGLCVLDLARAQTGLRGVASFHGMLTPAPWADDSPIDTKVVVFHGWDDPFAPPEDVVALAGELTRRSADWQLHAYGNTLHAFMAPFADQADQGIQYSATAAARAWDSFVGFLDEVLRPAA